MNANQLGPGLEAAIKEFANWWGQQLAESEQADSVKAPLYHYTDANGLLGIVHTQEIWFTNIFHLNDPSELSYGIEIALDILRKKHNNGSNAVKFFCERMESVFRKEIGVNFGFYVASFSRSPDDLGQWRSYADNGKGFALGLAPHLFHPESNASKKNANEIVFVTNVIYDKVAAVRTHEEAIGRAVSLIEQVERSALIGSESECHLFLRKMSVKLAAPILWNSITTKHPAYSNEIETRLMIVNDLDVLAPYVQTRTRSSNLVPFIKSPMPIHASGSIAEIVIGPSASVAESQVAVRSLLASHGLPESISIRQSEISYRAR